MIFDLQTRFSNAQALTATAVSTNVIDLGAAGIPYGHSAAVTRDQGVGMEVPLQIQVVTNFAGGTSVAVSVQTSTDEAFTSPVTVLSTPAVPIASLRAGYRFNIAELPEQTRLRYVRLNYTVVGTPTAGAITAGVVAARQTNPIAVGTNY